MDFYVMWYDYHATRDPTTFVFLTSYNNSIKHDSCTNLWSGRKSSAT